MEDDPQKTENAGVMYRLRPTKEVRTLLKHWKGITRKVYNKMINHIRKCGHNCSCSLKKLRAEMVKDSVYTHKEQYVKKYTPFDVRDEAIRDARKALESTKALMKDKTFKMHFRKKAEDSASFAVLKKRYNQTNKRDASKCAKECGRVLEKKANERKKEPRCGFGLLHRELLDTSGKGRLPEEIPADSRLKITQLGKVYLHVPVPVAKKQTKRGVAAIDPGVRSFATVYSAQFDNERVGVTEWGKEARQRLFRLLKHYDDLRSRIDTLPMPPADAEDVQKRRAKRRRRRYRMRRASLRSA